MPFSRASGGGCYLNFCAAGETLLYEELPPLVKALCAQGHYCAIVTNGTLSKKFDGIASGFSAEERSRLFMKFSFHYLQLKEKKLLDAFAANVDRMKAAGVSYTIEVTPHDELVPFIGEIREFSLSRFGALPHVTVARNMATREIALLTKYPREEYGRIWRQFESELFDFKLSVFNEKRREFCRAGELTLQLDLESGALRQCLCGRRIGNIYDLERPIAWRPIGRCMLPHCYNAHGFICFGAIRELASGQKIPTYADVRDRTCADGSTWLAPACRAFTEHYTWENSPELSEADKRKILLESGAFRLYSRARGLAGRARRLLGGRR